MVLVFALLALAVVLFASERLTVDVVALLLLSVLLVAGIVTPEEGFSGL